MKVLVSGGGSGGHIYPALAVATLLKKQYEASILYLGSDDGLETELAPAAGFPFAIVKAGKLRRYVSWQTFTGVARVPVGMAQAVGIVRRFAPDVVFTSGGYVAVPAGLAARVNNIPLLMHQQDVPPNLSNRLLAPMATRISVAFADSLSYFPERKTLALGNPIRQEMLDIRSVAVQEARRQLGLNPDLPLLLVTGGSQGARHLNQEVCTALPDLLPHCQVMQISGKQLFEETRLQSEQTMANLDAEARQRYHLVAYLNAEMPAALQAATIVLCRSGAATLSELAALSKPAILVPLPPAIGSSPQEARQRYHLVAYLNAEMPAALQAATIVLCRSGAATLSELAALSKPAILVPLPPAIGSSPQEANAAMFGRQKAAGVILDADLKREILVNRVISIITSNALLQSMSEAASTFAKPDATQDIAAEVVKMARAKQVKQVKTTGHLSEGTHR